MSDPREALLSRFRATLQERVRAVNALFDALVASNGDAEARKHVLGELHTLKGEARMLGLSLFSEVVHALEGHANGELSIGLVSRAMDALRLALDEATPEANSASLLTELLLDLAGDEAEASPEAPPAALGLEVASSAAGANGSEPLESDAEPRRARRWVQVSAELVDELCEHLVKLSATFGRLRSQSIGVLANGARDRTTQAAVIEDFARCQALLDDATTRSWSLRLVPVEPVLRELGQHARATAANTGKAVEVAVVASGVQVERDVLDALWDPLLHLVQNAVDHGLEFEGERGGKRPSGSLRIIAESSGASVVIHVEDDGRGIDPELVRERAVARGVLSPGTAAAMSRDDVVQLIFDHGFSTKTNVSALSGRGIGLDVVKRKLASLGGNVSVTSALGEGTRFSLWVPYTVTRERVLILQIADALYGLPSRTVLAVLGSEDGAKSSEAQPDVLRHEGESMPLASLKDALALEDEAPETRSIVVELAGRRYGLKVARVFGERELIRRPAERLLAQSSTIGASALLDDGRLVLLPDLGALQRSLRQAPLAPSRRERPVERKRQHALVVDDSLVVRDLIREILAGAGLSVETADDGVAALAAIERHEPDLVLTDLEMPRMNGFELLAEVRKRTQRLPVIMLTTRGSTEDRKRATELGANAYVLKIGFKTDALLDVVSRFVRVG